jgi:hypothetical protein
VCKPAPVTIYILNTSRHPVKNAVYHVPVSRLRLCLGVSSSHPSFIFFAHIVYMSLQTRMYGSRHVLKYFSRTVRAPGKIRGTTYVGNSLRDLGLHNAAAGRDSTASGQSRAGLAKARSAMVRREQDHRNNTIDITSQRNVGEERLN